jgi:hypothetical protein
MAFDRDGYCWIGMFKFVYQDPQGRPRVLTAPATALIEQLLPP